jgi:hypothetical protein
MLSRFRTRNCARILLAALLFAQAAVAAAACDMPDRAPAQAFTQQESKPCHEEPAQNANLCLAHCLSADQSADTPQVVVHPWCAAAPLAVAAPQAWSGRAVVWQRLIPHTATPPPRILFQSFQI